MTNAALRGKPDAGNPHVAPLQCYGGTGRFDEGEVASAATPRRGSLLYKKLLTMIVAAAVAVGTTFTAQADYWDWHGNDAGQTSYFDDYGTVKKDSYCGCWYRDGSATGGFANSNHNIRDNHL